MDPNIEGVILGWFLGVFSTPDGVVDTIIFSGTHQQPI
jgi:hypothetical protein